MHFKSKLLKFLDLLILCVCVCVDGSSGGLYLCHSVHVSVRGTCRTWFCPSALEVLGRKSEQILALGGRCLYLANHLAGPVLFIF